MASKVDLLYVSPVGFVGGAERVLLECVRQTKKQLPDWRLAAILFADGPLRPAFATLDIETRVLALPRRLANLGDSASIVTTAEALDELERVAQKNRRSRLGRLRDRAMNAKEAIPFVWKLREQLKELNPRVIHSNGLKSHLMLAGLRSRSSKLLCHVHDFYSERPHVSRWVQWVARRSHGAISISAAVTRDLNRLVPRWRADTIENAVDLEAFSPGVGDARRMDELAGLDPHFDGSRIGLIATYANWKGHDVFLEAASRVRGNFRAYIVGGPLYSTVGSQRTRVELASTVERLGLSDRVGFIDFQPEPAWVYRSLDVVVHASTRPEPFGLTIAEAMSCARPVILAAAGGANDLVRDGLDGLKFPIGDAGKLAEAIEKFINDRTLRERCSIAARQTAQSRFDPDAFGEKLIATYQNVAKLP